MIFADQGYLFWHRIATWYSNILPPLLSKWTTKEPMLHWLHRLQATMRATFVNLRHIFPTPLIHCHNLMDDRLKKGNLLLCLSFVQYDFSLRRSGEANFIPPLMWNRLHEDLTSRVVCKFQLIGMRMWTIKGPLLNYSAITPKERKTWHQPLH